MIVKAWMTATAVKWSDDDSGDYTEEHGWIYYPDFHELQESRNYVSPVAVWDSNDEDDVEDMPTIGDFIRATVSEFLGSGEDNGDGTIYGADSGPSAHGGSCRGCFEDERDWSYALHFEHKTFDHRGWVEIPVTAETVVK